jgi:tetratricopeptide (TPR) repeat protein
LPVHHLAGESGSIYAYSDDLDTWLKRRGRIGDLAEDAASNIEPLRADTGHDSPVHHDIVWDSSLISSQARVRSDQLVVLAAKMWEALSYRNLPRILHHNREAIDLNPGNAEAYAGLSLGLIAQGVWGLVSPPVAYASAKAALENAVKINPELALAKCASAWLEMVSTRDWHGARRGFEEILKHAPEFTGTINGRGLLYIAEGSLREASELFLQGAQQSPLSSASMTFYCWSQYLAGEFAYALQRVDEIRATGQTGPLLDAVEALAILRLEDREARMGRVEELAAETPNRDVLRGALGHAYAVMGRVQRAREFLESMTNRTTGRMSHEPYAIALILIGLNEKQQAIDCLERSYRDGSLWSLGFRSDPILEPLRNHSHFGQFFSKFSYPDPVNTDPQLGSDG